MSALAPLHQVSESLYWEKYYEHPSKNYEWNNGYLEEKPVSDYATFLIYNGLMKLFGFYFETHHNGSLVNLEMGFRLDLPDTAKNPESWVSVNSNPAYSAKLVHIGFNNCSQNRIAKPSKESRKLGFRKLQPSLLR